jgi:hypothetical protein
MTTQIRILAACMATVIVATAGWSVVRLSAAPDSEFQGVWRTVEVVVPGAPGSPSHTFKPGATLAIFHGRHYGRVEVHSEEPRTPLANVMTASADDIRAVWGPFVAEAGTFDVGANYTVTMQATVAKNPADMNTGATSVYTYKREGDRLLLTQVRTPTGPSRNPITVTLARVE